VRKGLACQYTGAEQPVCAQLKTKGQPCTGPYECAEGLECNPQTYLCDDAQDSTPTGPSPFCYLASDDKADSGTDDGGPTCKTGGQICEEDGDCCSGSCIGGMCVAEGECLGNGQFCTQNADCCTGTCIDNICGEPSACVPQYGQCTTTFDCCDGLVCDTGMCL